MDNLMKICSMVRTEKFTRWPKNTHTQIFRWSI